MNINITIKGKLMEINVGFGGLLTLIFTILKLTHIIDWSWWWVLCLIWIPFAILAMCGIISIVLILISNREW